jgi:lysozyme C
MEIKAVFLSVAAVLGFIKDAGFSDEVAPVMLCIVELESSFNKNAVNTNRNGSKDYGLFQINDKWWGNKCDVNRLFDPAYNAQCAKLVYDTQGLTAWVAYNNNKQICESRRNKDV